MTTLAIGSLVTNTTLVLGRRSSISMLSIRSS